MNNNNLVTNMMYSMYHTAVSEVAVLQSIRFGLSWWSPLGQSSTTELVESAGGPRIDWETPIQSRNLVATNCVSRHLSVAL